MAMTLKSLAAQMRAYRPEADEYKGKHIIPSWADELEAVDANLSAQAKVRENVNLEVDGLISAVKSLLSDAEEIETADGLMQAAQLHLWHNLEDALEKVGPAQIINFAARLSQGAQGEAREPRGQYLAHITANQAQNLLDYFGGGSTTYTLIRCEAGDCAQDDGSPAPAGLYVYDANCPEEGVNYLGEEDEDSKPRDDDDLAERAAVPDGWREEVQQAVDLLVSTALTGKGHAARNKLERLLTAAPQPPEGARVVADDGLYYLQDSRSYVGNCPTWWAKGRAGYTTRLDEAHRFTFDEAMRQHRERDTDIPWACAEIDALARRTVDMQHMRSIRAQCDLLAAPTLAGKEG